MCARNNCEKLFWMGNLKHRDLKGTERGSQLELAVDPSDDEDDLLPDEVRSRGRTCT